MRRRLALPLSIAVFAGASVLALTDSWPWPRLPTAEPIVVTRAFRQTSDTLRRGETVSELFARQGLASFDVGRLAREAGLDPRRLRSGLVFQFRHAVYEATPSEVVVRTGPEERIRLQREDETWHLQREVIAWRRETVRVGADIGTSLYAALDEGVPDAVLRQGERVRLAWDLADVFAWSVDFTRDIQPGDRFAAVIERQVSEEGEVRYGRVLAAALDVGGRTQTAFRFAPDGEHRFYDAQGNSLRRAFLRAPVEFRRISSRFSNARFHPILKVYRRHAGTDYSAAAGTPVMAAGDGTVTTAGWSGGYGILVELRHRNGISTRYAHLRALGRGIRAGARVAQGDVIGYVGSTGLSTSAHLHYEFRVNGVPRDPRSLKLEAGPPIPAAIRPAFEAERDRLAGLLAFRPAPDLPPARRGD